MMNPFLVLAFIIVIEMRMATPGLRPATARWRRESIYEDHEETVAYSLDKKLSKDESGPGSPFA